MIKSKLGLKRDYAAAGQARVRSVLEKQVRQAHFIGWSLLAVSFQRDLDEFDRKYLPTLKQSRIKQDEQSQ